MRVSSLLSSRSGARIPVDIIQPFVRNESIRLRYESCCQTGERLAVCLEGESGTAKGSRGAGEILWRLGSQGYATVSLPFVPWLQRQGVTAGALADELKGRALLIDLSERWQLELNKLIEASLSGRTSADGLRPGLVFVARSPLSSVRELKRRGISSWLPVFAHDRVVTIGLHADPIKRVRRVAEKTFNDPESVVSKLRICLAERHPEKEDVVPSRLAESIDSTSSKQAVAHLLTFVGVPQPTFPSFPWRTNSDKA